MEELIAKGEVRVGSPLELLWVRVRIVTLAVAVAAGAAYGAWFLLHHPISWWSLLLLIALAVSAVGMNLAYHPFFSHNAFRTSRPIKILLAIWGAANLRGPVIDWCARHRRHHKYTDIPDKDPHTPLQYGRGPLAVLAGLWWVFLGEKFSEYRTVNASFAPDLLKDRDLVLVNRLHDVLAVATVLGPGVIAWLVLGDLHSAVIAVCVLGCLRAAMSYSMISVVVNGLCHLIGTQPFKARDDSRNLAWLTLPTFGGSLHHTHHVFPKSLYVALDGELDPFDLLYWGLEKLGLIWDVHRPSPHRVRQQLASPDSGVVARHTPSR